LFDICTQLELAIEVLIESGRATDATNALGILEGFVQTIIIEEQGPVTQTVTGIFNCLEESWLPIAFPDTTTPPGNGIVGPSSLSNLQIPSSSLGMIH